MTEPANALDDLIREARGWISDCGWADIESDAELTDIEVVRGIARHFDGGWRVFTELCGDASGFPQGLSDLLDTVRTLAAQRFGADIASRMFP